MSKINVLSSSFVRSVQSRFLSFAEKRGGDRQKYFLQIMMLCEASNKAFHYSLKKMSREPQKYVVRATMFCYAWSYLMT